MQNEFEKLSAFLQSIEDTEQKSEMIKALKKIEKEANLLEFKVKRYFNEKNGLTSYLEQVTKEFEEVISNLEQQKNKAQKFSDELEGTLYKLHSSINYAKRIQEAVLGDFTILKNFVREAFIFYRPKDIVSGDFYWFGVKDGFKYICGIDCTGHGVSGAFMTLIANNHFNEVIYGMGCLSPENILKELDILMFRSLHYGSNASIRDGMDISVVRIDEANCELRFAGAHQDLLIFRGDEKIEMKGKNYAIDGILENKVPKLYTYQSFHYQKNDTFYLYSDGFKDQFGGADNLVETKKFGSKRLKNLLHQISNLDLKTQQENIKTTFEQWIGTHLQTDDVMLIGIRL